MKLFPRHREPGARGRRPSQAGGGRPAFTLIELLITVALLAVLFALLAPALRGLLGVTGPRGGMNTMSAALEQARLAAMESGVPCYLAWAPEATDAVSSAVIVFRDKKDGETADYIPVTRWLKLPQGVFLEPVGSFSSTSAGSHLPRLDGQTVSSVTFIKFDRFGRLFHATDPAVLRVGAKPGADGSFLGGTNQHFEFTVQPRTGRAKVVDKAMDGA